MDSIRETKIIDSGSVLIIQLLHYNNFKGAIMKNDMGVNCCSETLRLPISADEHTCVSI